MKSIVRASGLYRGLSAHSLASVSGVHLPPFSGTTVSTDVPTVLRLCALKTTQRPSGESRP